MAVTPGPTVWVDPEPLAEDLHLDVDTAGLAAREASWALWALSGRFLHAAGARVDLYRIPAGYHCGPDAVGQALTIKLMGPDPAVVSVRSYDPVTASYSGNLAGHWVLGRRLTLPAISSPAVEVNYTVGSNLPPGTDRAARALAEEHAKARTGKPCRLPNRITTATRSGASWTIFDPTDIIANGKTGIPEIDGWLSIVNPLVHRRRARIIDPRQPRLITGRWTD